MFLISQLFFRIWIPIVPMYYIWKTSRNKLKKLIWKLFWRFTVKKMLREFKVFSLKFQRFLKPRTTDTQRELFFKNYTFGLGQKNWAEILWGIWGISGQTIITLLASWVPCPWENVAGFLSYKKLWFLGLKHITPKCSHNKILAVKNLRNLLHTSVFSD